MGSSLVACTVAGTLLVGFDSAWTPRKTGALSGALLKEDGGVLELDGPLLVTFPDAREQIHTWQRAHAPSVTNILIDQPTIVTNTAGQRCVEHLVSSPVSRR